MKAYMKTLNKLSWQNLCISAYSIIFFDLYVSYFSFYNLLIIHYINFQHTFSIYIWQWILLFLYVCLRMYLCQLHHIYLYLSLMWTHLLSFIIIISMCSFFILAGQYVIFTTHFPQFNYLIWISTQDVACFLQILSSV